ncbi:MAG TPA: hydrolase TatD, partial [Clostridium sp.]|nr:hydrolase TatD [Clostridium sp.]
SPYMAPTPNRGKRNQSNYIKFIIEEIANIKGTSREQIEKITIFNTKSLFNLN